MLESAIVRGKRGEVNCSDRDEEIMYYMCLGNDVATQPLPRCDYRRLRLSAKDEYCFWIDWSVDIYLLGLPKQLWSIFDVQTSACFGSQGYSFETKSSHGYLLFS